MAITISGSGITSANIADGTIVNADINSSAAIDGSKLTGAGKVLQVVQGTTSTAVVNSTSTKVDTGLTATITPSATTSKILCMVTQTGCYKENSTSMDIQLQRNGTGITDIGKNSFYTGSTLTFRDTISGNYLDSPALTSAIVYKTQFASTANISQTQVQVNSSASTIILMEIGV